VASDGSTPLKLAIKLQQLAIARALLEAGANAEFFLGKILQDIEIELEVHVNSVYRLRLLQS
jgi:hypothetical protein